MQNRNQSQGGRRGVDNQDASRNDQRGSRDTSRRYQGGFQGQDESENYGHYDNDLDFGSSSRTGGSQSYRSQGSRGSGRGQGINDFEHMDNRRDRLGREENMDRGRHQSYRSHRDDDPFDNDYENDSFSGTGSDRSMGNFGQERNRDHYDERSQYGTGRGYGSDLNQRGYDRPRDERDRGMSHQRYSGRSWDQDETGYQGRGSQRQEYRSSHSEQDRDVEDHYSDNDRRDYSNRSRQDRFGQEPGHRGNRSGRGSSRY